MPTKVKRQRRRRRCAPAVYIPGLLTLRQEEILELISKSFTYAEIAKKLRLGHETIKTHMSRIRAKIGLYRRGELTTWWLHKNTGG